MPLVQSLKNNFETMFKELKSNIIYFNNDDDFYRFCVVPQLFPVECVDDNGNVSYYTDFDFTYEYKKALEDNMFFMIKDENSNIFKNQCVSYRTITKPVSNLKQYFNI